MSVTMKERIENPESGRDMDPLQRIERLEKTVLLALAVMTGEPEGASAEERDFMRRQLAQWIEDIQGDLRHD